MLMSGSSDCEMGAFVALFAATVERGMERERPGTSLRRD